MSDKPRVLVTGGAGYIGSVLAEKLLRRGYSVRVLDSMFFGRHGLAALEGNPLLEVVEGRIEQAETVRRAVKGIGCVMHLAGLANDSTCDIDPALTKRMNFGATMLLLKHSREAGASRFIYGSSAAVYGASKETALTEESPVAPVSLYAKYRVKCEQEVSAAGTKDFTTCSLRKSTVFGYSPRQRLDLVVNAMTLHALNKGRVCVMGGSQWRPNLHVEDAAETYIACLEAELSAINREAFNVGAPEENMQVSRIAEIVASEIPGTEIGREPARDTISYNLNFDKLYNTLGFRCGRTVRQGISELALAFRAGKIPDYENDVYYNMKRMEKLAGEGRL